MVAPRVSGPRTAASAASLGGRSCAQSLTQLLASWTVSAFSTGRAWPVWTNVLFVAASPAGLREGRQRAKQFGGASLDPAILSFHLCLYYSCSNLFIVHGLILSVAFTAGTRDQEGSFGRALYHTLTRCCTAFSRAFCMPRWSLTAPKTSLRIRSWTEIQTRLQPQLRRQPRRQPQRCPRRQLPKVGRHRICQIFPCAAREIKVIQKYEEGPELDSATVDDSRIHVPCAVTAVRAISGFSRAGTYLQPASGTPLTNTCSVSRGSAHFFRHAYVRRHRHRRPRRHQPEGICVLSSRMPVVWRSWMRRARGSRGPQVEGLLPGRYSAEAGPLFDLWRRSMRSLTSALSHGILVVFLHCRKGGRWMFALVLSGDWHRERKRCTKQATSNVVGRDVDALWVHI